MTLGIDWKLGKRILALAYPVTIAMLTQTAINLIDTIMVGRLPAEWSIAGQSAIMFSLILMWAVGGFIASVGVGTQALTARRIGEERPHRAGQVLTNAVAVAATVAIAASLVVIWYLPDIFPHFHANPAVVDLGVEYSTYRFAGVPSMVLTIVYKGFFDGLGRTKVHMKAAITMNLANVVLNYVFIFGLGPIPPMYVAGAGVASFVATHIGLWVMVHETLRPESLSRYGLYRLRTLDLGVTWSILRIGVPGGAATLIVMVGFAAFSVVIGWLDQDAVRHAAVRLPAYAQWTPELFARSPGSIWTPELYRALVEEHPPVFTSATKVIMDIMSVVFMSCMALGQATATLVGQSLGGRDPDLAEAYGWQSVRIGAMIMAVIGALILLFPDTVAGWFNPDPSVIVAARPALRLMAVATPLIAVAMVLAQSLFGAGVTVYVATVELTLHFLCLIPVAYVGGIVLHGGLVGAWTAAFAYITLLAVAMGWKFRGGTWKATRI